MRSNICSTSKIYNLENVKKINKTIKENLIEGNDNLAGGAIKSSQVEFVRLVSIQNLLVPLIDFALSSNNQNYGFDLFPLTAGKILNYNSYSTGEEYSWHIDADTNSPIRDIKLTCLLNLSEDFYDGGDLYLFRNKEVKVEKFDVGCATIFPSFTSHKVSKILKGERKTLAIWFWGPKFR